MEEKEALLYKENNTRGHLPRNSTCKFNEDGDQDVSSEDSDEWWEESQSGCSSCCDHSSSSLEWEKEVNSMGQLFYVESDNNVTGSTSIHESKKPSEVACVEKVEREENLKKGKLLNWMRRRESKKMLSNKPVSNSSTCQYSTQETLATGTNDEGREEQKQVILKIDTIGNGTSLCEKLLGLSLGMSEAKELFITNIIPGGPAQLSNELKIGDIIYRINNYNLATQNIESILQSLNYPCEVTVYIQKPTHSSEHKKIKFHSPFVQSLIKKNKSLEDIFLGQEVGVVVVDVESQNLNKDDVIYCYPEKCILSSCRGAFVTLYHLLAEIKPNDVCQSSSVVIKKQPTHVLYSSDDNFLLLIAIPQVKCTLKEATYIVHDLIRNLLFSHQTLKRCFGTSDKSDLDHFFSLFFSRLLSDEFSGGVQFTAPGHVPIRTPECASPQFEDIMPYATWVPLPKEVQIQIDEALNELEANDFETEDEDNIENQRIFNIMGSCLFHKGYLLASHLTKDDLLDVNAFYRQNCLTQLFRKEPVKSLVIWREVFPLSVGRGLPSTKPTNYVTPTGRWFMLTVGQGYDSLSVILEAGECCAKIEGNRGPVVSYVEEVEDTLRHTQKLGISALASQWIESNSRFKTVTPEEVFAKKANLKKENLLGFVKNFEGAPKSSVFKVPPTSLKQGDVNPGKKGRSNNHETSEDSVSQTPSNVSEVSDENAPILGRRAERGKALAGNLSGDSDSSDSDWDSSIYQDSNTKESTCSSGLDNFYLCNVGEILPARLTTGPEDILFYYVHLDGNEGVLVKPPLNAKRSTPKMREILKNFRRCAQIIHSILENNIRFKKNSQDNSKCFINKSLVAVKEHGVIYECISTESDSKKPVTFTYWIVGRLFFTPQPREIYVCYYEDAPQNLVEIAFRLGLNTSG